MENSRGSRVKVVGIPGVCQNLREKRGFLKELMQKKRKIPRGYDKIDWKSRGVNFKKIDILNRRGETRFDYNITTIRRIQVGI